MGAPQPDAGPAAAHVGANLGDEFVDVATQCLADGNLDRIPDEELRRVLTAALKLFAAKVESRGEHIDPVDAGQITPTEVVTMSAALLRTSGLNLFDLSMWLGRTR
jgi:hypothetical protein